MFATKITPWVDVVIRFKIITIEAVGVLILVLYSRHRSSIVVVFEPVAAVNVDVWKEASIGYNSFDHVLGLDNWT